MDYKDAIEKYGEVNVQFSDYYKYTFGFKGVLGDGLDIYVTVGGSDDIYRFEVHANVDYKVNSLGVNYGQIKKDGVLIEEFRDTSW